MSAQDGEGRNAKGDGPGMVSPFGRTSDGVLVAVRLTPRARRAGVQGTGRDADGRPRLLVAVNAPPADGAANAALIALLAAAWRVPKSSLSIRTGAAAREKLLHLAGDPQMLVPRLDAWLNGPGGPGGPGRPGGTPQRAERE